MGGGLASFLPYKVKKIGWDTIAKIRHAVLGDGTTNTSNTSHTASGTVAVGEPSVDKKTNELIRGFENNLKNGILSLADVKANVHSMLPDVKAQIYRKHPEWAYSQGVTSNKQPVNTEAGYKSTGIKPPKPHNPGHYSLTEIITDDKMSPEQKVKALQELNPGWSRQDAINAMKHHAGHAIPISDAYKVVNPEGDATSDMANAYKSSKYNRAESTKRYLQGEEDW